MIERQCDSLIAVIGTAENLRRRPMFKERGLDRRVKETALMEGSEERRHIVERRRIEISESPYDEFEILMSALGFRPAESRVNGV
jgi:hypothetical protein